MVLFEVYCQNLFTNWLWENCEIRAQISACETWAVPCIRSLLPCRLSKLASNQFTSENELQDHTVLLSVICEFNFLKVIRRHVRFSFESLRWRNTRGLAVWNSSKVLMLANQSAVVESSSNVFFQSKYINTGGKDYLVWLQFELDIINSGLLKAAGNISVTNGKTVTHQLLPWIIGLCRLLCFSMSNCISDVIRATKWFWLKFNRIKWTEEVIKAHI